MIIDLFIFFATGGFWTTLALALAVVFSPSPRDENLRSYNKAKYIMAFAYLLSTIFNSLVITGIIQETDIGTLKMTILILSIFQLILFTHINLTLLNSGYLSIRLLIRQLTSAFVLSLFGILSLLLDWGGIIEKIAFYSLIIYFIIALLIVTRLFVIHYKKYRKRVDNYFTGVSTDRLKWIWISCLFLFFTGIFIVIISLTFPVITTPLYLLYILFYITYAIHFLNYKSIFYAMAPALNEVEEKPLPTSSSSSSSSYTFSQIEKAVEKWEKQKLFTNPKITIVKVASQISTNRAYLSQYINGSKQKTFNEWINGLRIDEAKKLMTTNKNMTIEEISEKVGYTDKGYFSKCFVRYAGMTITQWRAKHL